MRFISLVVFFLFFFVKVSGQERPIRTLNPGDHAPSFNLPGVDGKTYSLKDFDDYPYLVIIFTCNHCPTAQAYEKKIIDAVNRYRDKGVGFVAISPNSPEALSLSELGYSDMGDSFEDMKQRAKYMQYNFPYLYDGDSQEVSIAYGPIATPHIFIFDKTRSLVYTGRIDDTENPYIDTRTKDMEVTLEALLGGTNIEISTTRTFGCSIKWAWKSEWKNKLLSDWAKEPVTINDIDLKLLEELLVNRSEDLLMINFWATWCGPCVVEFPELVTINRMYRERNFKMVTISVDKSNKKGQALAFLTKQQASNINYIFTGENVYDLMETVDSEWQGAIPYTLLIEPDGNIIYRFAGMIDPLDLKQKIVDYLGRYYADNP